MRKYFSTASPWDCSWYLNCFDVLYVIPYEQKVRRSAQTKSPVFSEMAEMTCKLRRWQHSRTPSSPISGVFGDESNPVMSEIVLCPLIAPDSPPKLGLRSRSNSVYSDLSTLVSPAAHDVEDLNNLAPYSVVPSKKQGRSRSEGLVFPYNIDQQQSQPRGRRRRTMSTTFTGATGSASLSACSTLNSYRISLSDITMTTIYSPSALQQIDIATVGKGCYELHFDTKNAYDVVLTFLQSLLPKSRKQIRFHEQLAKNMSTPSPNKSVASNSPNDRQNRSSECMSRSGSFDMDQFMEQKLKERVNNESAFERFKRKMSKLSQDVNERKFASLRPPKPVRKTFNFNC